MTFSAPTAAALNPKLPARNTREISDLMFFMFITSFPANSRPLLCLTRERKYSRNNIFKTLDRALKDRGGAPQSNEKSRGLSILVSGPSILTALSLHVAIRTDNDR